MDNARIYALKNKSNNLPGEPGVYIMKNKENQIIYIGKAKSLKNRVSQYFGLGRSHSVKVKQMVLQIEDFDYIITDNEFEALVLECNLIKLHSPKYNILLKDDKGYYYIKITNECWPRILSTNQKLEDGSEYIGPFTSSWSTKKSVEEANKIYKLPTCSRDFTKGLSKPCLSYHINQCMAPCYGKIKREEYIKLVTQAIFLLKNGTNQTIKELYKKMEYASEKLQFEKAAEIRDRIKSIEKMNAKQKVVCSRIKDQDIIALVHNSSYICAEVFRFLNGNLYKAENFLINFYHNLKVSRTEFLERYYHMQKHIPKRIFLDGEIEGTEIICEWLSKKSGHKVRISIPKSGEQLRLLEMCKNNAYEVLQKSSKDIDDSSMALEQLADILSLNSVPEYIEAYDISNIQGSENVGGLVLFKNGQIDKTGYRRFIIKTIKGQDDYGSIREMISRRINEYKSSKISDRGFGRLPDLMLIDGGRGHVNTVRKLLLKLNINIPVFGMVKDNNHKTRALTSDKSEIDISRNRQIFMLITRIQDEVHRFTIQYHRMRKSKSLANSQLLKINGIGAKRSNLLLKRFGSIKRLSMASIEELKLIPGMTESSARAVYDYFNKG